MDDQGRLRNISIVGKEQNITAIFANDEFQHVSVGFLKQYKASERLTIIGSLIDDDYLSQLSQISFEDTKILQIGSKSVTIKGILELPISSNLRELVLERAIVSESQEKELASRFSNVRISFFASLS